MEILRNFCTIFRDERSPNWPRIKSCIFLQFEGATFFINFQQVIIMKSRLSLLKLRYGTKKRTYF